MPRRRTSRSKSNYDPQGFFQHAVAASQRKGQTIRPKSSNLSSSGVRPSATNLEASRQLLIDYHYFTGVHQLIFSYNIPITVRCAYTIGSILPSVDWYRLEASNLVRLLTFDIGSDFIAWLTDRRIGPGSHVSFYFSCFDFTDFSISSSDVYFTDILLSNSDNGEQPSFSIGAGYPTGALSTFTLTSVQRTTSIAPPIPYYDVRIQSFQDYTTMANPGTFASGNFSFSYARSIQQRDVGDTPYLVDLHITDPETIYSYIVEHDVSSARINSLMLIGGIHGTSGTISFNLSASGFMNIEVFPA